MQRHRCRQKGSADSLRAKVKRDIMKNLSGLIPIAVLMWLGVSGAANAASSGDYAPAKWTFFSSDGGGSIDATGAPSFLTLTGSDKNGNSATSGYVSDQDITIAAVAESIVSFTGTYETFDVRGPSYDPVGLLLNGVFTQLTDNFGADFQTDSFSFHVNAGDIFGFRAHSVDSSWGGSESVGFNFEITPVPEPETYALFMAGLGLMGFIARRRKNGRA